MPATPLRQFIDLRQPPQLLVQNPILWQTASDLLRFPQINPTGDYVHFTWGELLTALHNPYVTPEAKARLQLIAQAFFEPSPATPGDQGLDGSVSGLPPERARVRQVLLARGQQVFQGAYPADLPVPPALQSLDMRVPFPPGTTLMIQQGNNTMAAPASHGPADLRYALDFVRPDGSDSTGLPLVAPAGGVAYVYDRARVNCPDNWGFGNLVLVDHGNGYASLLAHMDEIHVRNGQRVAAGADLGTVGTSGSAGNAHLHFQVVSLLRTPNPATEVHHGEFSQPYAPRPQPPFGGTVPFLMTAADLQANGAVRRVASWEFQGGEAGVLMENAGCYRAAPAGARRADLSPSPWDEVREERRTSTGARLRYDANDEAAADAVERLLEELAAHPRLGALLPLLTVLVTSELEPPPEGTPAVTALPDGLDGPTLVVDARAVGRAPFALELAERLSALAAP